MHIVGFGNGGEEEKDSIWHATHDGTNAPNRQVSNI